MVVWALLCHSFTIAIAFRSYWQYCSNELAFNKDDITEFNANNTDKNLKLKLTGQTGNYGTLNIT